jgi:hypothetical protein
MTGIQIFIGIVILFALVHYVVLPYAKKSMLKAGIGYIATIFLSAALWYTLSSQIRSIPFSS